MPRAKKKIHYIYKTTCTVTGRYYIGMHSTNNLDDGYLGSGKRLRRSIQKYGKDKHTKEILEYCDNRELLAKREHELITEELRQDPKCMNLMGGGFGGLADSMTPDRMREIGKIGLATRLLKMNTDNEYRHKHCNNMSKRMRELYLAGQIVVPAYNWIGRKHKPETIEKMKLVKKNHGIGSKNSQYGTCWITKDGIDKKIQKDEALLYINLGWIYGRKSK
jgi:hypothetical protein